MVIALDRLFFFSALGGGVLFVIQLILLFLGGGGDMDLETDVDINTDASHPGADLSFKVLSLQGITAFVMMFGLVGWAMRSDSDAGPLVSLAAASIAGGASTWVIGKIFSSFRKLQSSGTLDLRHAVGATGQVYLTVRADKPGKVNITVRGRLLTMDAVLEATGSNEAESLETGTPIKVVRVISDTTVSVEKN